MAIIQRDDLPAIRERHHQSKIVFSSGVFDLVHAGHVLFFEDCKKHGDILVVCIGNDVQIKHLKGPERPVLNQWVRLKTVDALKPVDYVFMDDSDAGRYPLEFLNDVLPALRPDVYVVNDDAFDIPYRRDTAKKFGVEFAVLSRSCPPEFENISTTKIMEKIRKSAGGIG